MIEKELYQPLYIQEEKKLVWPLIIIAVGGILMVNAFIAERLFPYTPEIGGLSALAGALILGLPLIAGSLKGFFTGRFKLTELTGIAIMASISLEDYRTAGIVAFIFMLGHLLQQRTALGARKSIESLLQLTPPTAHLVEEGTEKDVLVKELKVGDIIRIKPGENVPADGIIEDGETTVNEASITGESLPVDKMTKDQIFEGTNNITGVILVKVIKVGKDTTLGKVKELILQAEKTRIPIISIMEKYTHWYIPVILMISGMMLFFTRDASRAIAAIIVGVPCVLLLATPTAIIAVLSVAARSGIMIKEAQKIEVAGGVNAIIFDKTGTLTTGELKVSSLNPENNISAEKFLSYVGTLEKYSLHPVAKAVRELVKKVGLKLTEPEEFKEVGGKGIKGKVEGHNIVIGRESWLKENKVKVPSNKMADRGSIIHVSVDGNYCGWVGLEDQMRIEAKETTDTLKKMGIKRLVMLTGDKKEVAEKIAQESGFEEVVAECFPETKLEIVEDLKKKGYNTLVIGDGINDAPALAAGNIGVAMGAMGSDVAINSASVALMSNDLRRVPFFISISRLSYRIIYQNIAFGVAFVLLGLVFVGAGIFSPIIAALYHEVGSLVAVFNSARIVKYE